MASQALGPLISGYDPKGHSTHIINQTIIKIKKIINVCQMMVRVILRLILKIAIGKYRL